MGEKLSEANDNDKPITDYGPFPRDTRIDSWLIRKPPLERIIRVPWGDGFMVCRE